METREYARREAVPNRTEAVPDGEYTGRSNSVSGGRDGGRSREYTREGVHEGGP
jgi:hypothetical protein